MAVPTAGMPTRWSVLSIPSDLSQTIALKTVAGKARSHTLICIYLLSEFFHPSMALSAGMLLETRELFLQSSQGSLYWLYGYEHAATLSTKGIGHMCTALETDLPSNRMTPAAVIRAALPAMRRSLNHA